MAHHERIKPESGKTGKARYGKGPKEGIKCGFMNGDKVKAKEKA